MGRYVVRRLLMLVPVILIVATVVFAVIHLIPGDPARVAAGPEATEESVEAIRTSLGLDKPLFVQYLLFMQRLTHGDLGRSILSGSPVANEIAARFPYTIKLTIGAMMFALVLGPLLGIVAAFHQGSLLDYLASSFAVGGLSVPSFWLGIMLILLFSERLHWLPSIGAGGLSHWILPCFTLSTPTLGMLAMMMRATLLEVLGEPYIQTAHAKGVPGILVLTRHALKNTMIPMVTIIGMQLGFMLGGAMVVEEVFSLPGLGRLVVSAVLNKDYPVMQGVVLLLALTVVVLNLLTDLFYFYLDPRIRPVEQ